MKNSYSDKNTYGLYIHIPFCLKKCKYCDFTSFCNKEQYFDLYIDELIKEAYEYKGLKTDTIFIGGGTPTALSSPQLEKFLSSIHSLFTVEKNCEISIEANPKTLDAEKLNIIKKYGVNRLSIGVQSFNNKELSAIGRIHNSETAISTVSAIKKAGFENFNLDLMSDLPLQTESSFLNSLNTAISLQPTHISCYSLILEENTPLFSEYQNGIYKPSDDEFDRNLYHLAVSTLKKYGYERYEISNFSKPGYECRHNIKYWSCDEYIGLGVSAHSYFKGKRYYNTSSLSAYLNGKYHEPDVAVLSLEDKISDYIIMKLRMDEGISEKHFYELFGRDFHTTYNKQIDKFLKNNLMERRDGIIRLTDSGIDISNSILCEFV